MRPWDHPTQKKSDFFNERILINGRRRLSKHAPRHLPPIFFFNRARFRRERADLVPFILVLMLLIRVVEYETIPIPDRQPLVPLLWTGVGGTKRRAGSWITTDQRNSGLLLSLLAGTETAPPTTPLHLRKYARKQISSCCSSNAHDVDVRCCSEA